MRESTLRVAEKQLAAENVCPQDGKIKYAWRKAHMR
jgi:hypothetical protein